MAEQNNRHELNGIPDRELRLCFRCPGSGCGRSDPSSKSGSRTGVNARTDLALSIEAQNQNSYEWQQTRNPYRIAVLARHEHSLFIIVEEIKFLSIYQIALCCGGHFEIQ